MNGPVHVADDFDPVRSVTRDAALEVVVVDRAPDGATVLAVPVGAEGDVPDALGCTRAALDVAQFTGAVGSALVVPQATGIAVAYGTGAGGLSATEARDAAGAAGAATAGHGEVTVVVPTSDDAAATTAAVVEGVVLSRYSYDALKSGDDPVPLRSLTVVVAPGDLEAGTAAAARGRILAAANALARDLANTPPTHLTAPRIAALAESLAPRRGLGVEVFDEVALAEMGCGGILGVNAGSAVPPRMIKLTYAPDDDAADAPHLTLVGKGVMYDSGGLNLKPSDPVHASMKNDMSGAAAVFAAMCSLRALECPTRVTAYLMCTDNLPSGTAIRVGDVMTIRGGTTVEVVNTDAEGRLIMADALVLGTEEPTDAMVDIATLTGACMRALGASIAGVMGTEDAVIDQLRAAGTATDEPIWPFPLEPKYRAQLDSDVADLKNLGGDLAGQITAGLFLKEFVGDVPWAHLDIAGTADNPAPGGWRTKGCTGFGARLLAEFACAFRRPR